MAYEVEHHASENPVASIGELRRAIRCIIQRDEIDWKRGKELIALMISMERHQKSILQLVGEHFSSLQQAHTPLEVDQDLEESQQSHLRRMFRASSDMRGRFVSTVLLIASSHVYETWTRSDMYTIGDFWATFNYYFEHQSEFKAEFRQNLTQEEDQVYFQPAQTRLITAVHAASIQTNQIPQGLDYPTSEQLRTVLATCETSTDYLSILKAEAASIPQRVQQYAEAIDQDLTVINKIIATNRESQ